MSKGATGITATGTIGNVTFFRMDGKQYMRGKSSLTRKRVLNAPEFESTRKHASHFGRASALASEIYQLLPQTAQGRPIFRTIAGEAASLLYTGKEEQEVKDILLKKYIKDPDCENVMANYGKDFKSPQVRKMNRHLRSVFFTRLVETRKPTKNFARAWRQGEPFKPKLFGDS
jgi:hypothetical protein